MCNPYHIGSIRSTSQVYSQLDKKQNQTFWLKLSLLALIDCNFFQSCFQLRLTLLPGHGWLLQGLVSDLSELVDAGQGVPPLDA